VCYRGAGWTLDDRQVFEDGEAARWPRMEANFSKPEAGAHAFLTVCAFDETGAPIELPTLSFWEDAWKALKLRKVRNHQVVFQIQVWTTASAPIGVAEQEMARQLLMTARERFRAWIAAPAAETLSMEWPFRDKSCRIVSLPSAGPRSPADLSRAATILAIKSSSL
jgi:hypothetical protein